MLPDHFKLDVQPVATPEAVVLAPRVRFTILTSCLLRLEYSPIDRFEDRASQIFWHRAQPIPPFEVERTADQVVITTRSAVRSTANSGTGCARYQNT